jgi:hypothetical protein
MVIEVQRLDAGKAAVHGSGFGGGDEDTEFIGKGKG